MKKSFLKITLVFTIILTLVSPFILENRAEANCYPVKACNTKPKSVKLGTQITISKTYTKAQLQRNKSIASSIKNGTNYIGGGAIAGLVGFSAATAGASAVGAGAVGAGVWTVSSISDANIKLFNQQIKNIRKGHTKLVITKKYKYQWDYESIGNSSVRKVKRYVLVGQPSYQSKR